VYILLMPDTTLSADPSSHWAGTLPSGWRQPVVLGDAIPSHPLLQTATELGRGEHSIVLDYGHPDRVLKLVSSPADYFFYTAADRPYGEHFPIVHADHGIVGRAQSGFPFHLIELERLFPIPNHSQAAQLACYLTDQFWCGCQRWAKLAENMGRIALYHMVVEPGNLPNSLQQALKALSDFIESYEVSPDLLNPGNLMIRKDGTLVLSDPVFIA
jgi:hypothetical protein